MPHGWTEIGGTPEWLAECWGNPGELKKRVYDHVTEAGAALEHVYWAQDGTNRILILVSFGGKDAGTVPQKLKTHFEQDFNVVLSTVEKIEKIESMGGEPEEG